MNLKKPVELCHVEAELIGRVLVGHINLFAKKFEGRAGKKKKDAVADKKCGCPELPEVEL